MIKHIEISLITQSLGISCSDTGIKNGLYKHIHKNLIFTEQIQHVHNVYRNDQDPTPCQITLSSGIDEQESNETMLLSGILSLFET
jgi:hypothetical protein